MTDLELTKKAVEELNILRWESNFYAWQYQHGLDFINLNVELSKAIELLTAYTKKLEE